MGKTSVYIGTSGYSYPHWGDGLFYPHGLASNKWLEYYCRHFDSVELNVSFYRLPSPAAFSSWRRRTPSHFRFAVKGSRYITHLKRLKDSLPGLELFFSRAQKLEDKLSVVLWQLPPQFKLNLPRLTEFIANLAKIAVCRQVVEFRHPSWFSPDVFRLLKDNDITLCSADWPPYSQEAPTAAPADLLHKSKTQGQATGFVYIRRHGTTGRLYGGCYSKKQLKQDVSFIESSGKDCYIYFNNDANAWAVKNALTLKELLQK